MTIDLAGAAPTFSPGVPPPPPGPRGPRAVGHLLARAAWLVALLVPCIPLHLAWSLAGARSPWAQWFLGRAARASGVRVTTRGTPLTRDVVLVGNHVSWVDILAIGGATPVRFIAQDRIRHWPLIGWLAMLNATIFVSRTDRVGVAGQIERVRAAIAGQQPVAIFPEGTTTDGRSLLPFKPALFAALERPPRALMVQPVVLEFDDIGASLAWIGIEEGAANAWRVLGRGGTFGLGVDFLEPFDCSAMNRKAIAAEARARIAAALTRRFGLPVA